ncbi:MAG: hypothetical protein AAF525_13580, partial [Pseudomonadota bacterium]
LFRIGAQNLRYHLDPLMHAVNIGAMCGIVALLVDGMASFFIRVPASNRVFWIVVALIVAINYWNRHNYALRQQLMNTSLLNRHVQ